MGLSVKRRPLVRGAWSPGTVGQNSVVDLVFSEAEFTPGRGRSRRRQFVGA
jgi:hypothetical protein